MHSIDGNLEIVINKSGITSTLFKILSPPPPSEMTNLNQFSCEILEYTIERELKIRKTIIVSPL